MTKNRILSTKDIVVVSIVSITVMLLINVDTLFKSFFSAVDEESSDLIFNQIATFSEKIIGFVSENLLRPTIATFLLWSVLGLVCYVLANLFFSRAQNVSESFSLAYNYIHPRNYNPKSYWLHFIVHIISSIAKIGMLFIWLLLIATVFLPFSSRYLRITILEDLSLLDRLISLGYSFLGVFTGIIGLLVIKRLFTILHNNDL